VALLEVFLDYTHAIIVDAIYTRKHPPGTLLELKPSDLDRVIAPSPHYAGLPELIAMAHQMEFPFPEEIVILAMEVEDPLTIGGEMTEPVRQALAPAGIPCGRTIEPMESKTEGNNQ
jgi:hydrogenase maturation protease